MLVDNDLRACTYTSNTYLYAAVELVCLYMLCVLHGVIQKNSILLWLLPSQHSFHLVILWVRVRVPPLILGLSQCTVIQSPQRSPRRRALLLNEIVHDGHAWCFWSTVSFWP